MGNEPSRHDPLHIPARLLIGLIGLCLCAAGITFLSFIWNDSEFPPLPVKIVFSLFLLPFLFFGCLFIAMGIFGKRIGDSLSHSLKDVRMQLPPESSPSAQIPGSYACDRCGAPLGASANVSPLGDVKCGHCGRWFNIHQPA
jgi:DNA-directed RNA polymerase subunit RPC12/RpoP